MKNVQVSMDEKLLQQVDRAARPLRLTRSAAIREAVRAWLRSREIDRFEREWIRALGASPGDPAEAEAWRGAQIWSDE